MTKNRDNEQQKAFGQIPLCFFTAHGGFERHERVTQRNHLQTIRAGDHGVDDVSIKRMDQKKQRGQKGKIISDKQGLDHPKNTDSRTK